MLRHKILNEFQDLKTKEHVKPGSGDGYYKPRDAEQLGRLVSAGCLDPNDTRGERTEPAVDGLESVAESTGEEQQQGGSDAADVPAGSDAAQAADANTGAAESEPVAGAKGRGGRGGRNKAGTKANSRAD